MLYIKRRRRRKVGKVFHSLSFTAHSYSRNDSVTSIKLYFALKTQVKAVSASACRIVLV